MKSVTTARAVARERACVVGLGGDFGDDRLGWWVVDQLCVPGDRHAPAVQVARAATPVEVLAFMEGIQELVIIDACQGLGSSGDIVRLTWPTAQIAKLRQPFGHNLSLDAAFELAAKIGQLPDICEIWCVEGRQFGFRQSLSPEVEAAGQRLAGEIAARFGGVGFYA